MRIAFLIFALSAVGVAQPQPPVRAFPDYSNEELLRAVPDLAGIRFASSQTELDSVLRATGENLNNMLAGFIGVSAAEDIHELRFDRGGTVAGRHERFRYVARFAAGGTGPVLNEFRVLPTGDPPAPAGASSFLELGHFVALLSYLQPENRGQCRFRLVGSLRAGGGDEWVVAFAQLPGSMLRSNVVTADGTARLHGLVWIDAATHRVERMHVELADRIPNFPFETLATDIVFAPVSFRAVDGASWLPARVTVHARFAGGELHTVHRFSDYRVWDDGLDSAKNAGTPATVADTSEDAFEVLARGIALAEEHKTAEAVTAMREAVRLDPASPLVRFHLAVALNSTGDAAGAETELREGLRRSPDYGPAHNYLAMVLLERGDVRGAVDEFRTSARLQPKEAVVEYNLGQALEKLGDRKAAIDAYRNASALAPDNADYRAHLEQAERTAGQGEDTTIRVDVRQVLVPVIVTDKDGHHVTGLTQADFHVFEDGVEQKITSFHSEDASGEAPDSPGPEPAPAGSVAPAQSAAPERRVIRRTYVICLDTLHTDPGNLVYARKALEKLFRAEQAGDSQYIVVAVGTSTEILENTTPDPALVLQALDSPDFQKHLLDSRRSARAADLSRFRRSLDDVYRLCIVGDPACESRKRTLPLEADQVAMQERVYTATFLDQLRGVVAQLSRGTDRRSLLLISDGFQLVPGKEAYELLRAYFPEFRFESLKAVDRMQTEFDQVVRLASKSNVTMYTLDSRGLYTQSAFDASNGGGAAQVSPAVLSIMDRAASDDQSTLAEIADATGGTAFRNNNDILGGLERAFADGREYYMLAYIPSNPNMDGKFRAITVRVRGHNVAARAKRGYWATGQ